MNQKNITAPARYAVRKKRYHKIDGLFSRNPVFVGGLLLAPAVVAAFSLKNAVALSITLVIVTAPTLILASLMRDHLPMWQRVPIYVLSASLLLIPAYFAVAPIAPTIFDSLGMYFSLMALNSVLFARAERCAIKNPIHFAVVDGLSYCGGFALAVGLIGALRELLAANTLWGIPVAFPFKITSMALPFMGFLLIGMLSGIGRYFRNLGGLLSNSRAQSQMKRKAQLAPPAPRRDGPDAEIKPQGGEAI